MKKRTRPASRPPIGKINRTGLSRIQNLGASPKEMSLDRICRQMAERLDSIVKNKKMRAEDMNCIHSCLLALRNGNNMDNLMFDTKNFCSWPVEEKAVRSGDFNAWLQYMESVKMLGHSTEYRTVYVMDGDQRQVLVPGKHNQFSCPVRPTLMITLTAGRPNRFHVSMSTENGKLAFVDYGGKAVMELNIDPEKTDQFLCELKKQKKIAKQYGAFQLADALCDISASIRKHMDRLLESGGSMVLESDA